MITALSFSNFIGFTTPQELSFLVSDGTPNKPCFRETKAGRVPTVIGIFGPNGTGKTTVMRAALAACNFASGQLHGWNGEGVPPYLECGDQHSPLELSVSVTEPETGIPFFYCMRVQSSKGQDGSKVPIRVVEYENLSGGPHPANPVRFNRYGPTGFKIIGSAELGAITCDHVRCDRSVIGSFAGRDGDFARDMHRVYGIMGNTLTNLEPADLGPHLSDFGMGHLDLLKLSISSGRVCFIDDIDARLDWRIVLEVMRWFSDPASNPKNAQLIFTAHNPMPLDAMVSAQVVICDRYENGHQIAYNATRVKGVRRYDTMMDDYISGRLGGLQKIFVDAKPE